MLRLLEAEPEDGGPEAFVGRDDRVEGELALDAEPARFAVSPASIGVGRGLFEGLRSAGGSRGGTSQPVSPGMTRSSVPSTDVPTTARRAAMASSTAFGMPSQCEARTSTSAALSSPGTSSRRPSQWTWSRKWGRPSIASSSQPRSGPSPATARCQSGRPRDHPLGRVEQVGQSLLGIEPAHAERQVGVIRHADRCTPDRLGRVVGSGVDPVGDDRQPRRVELADVAAERQHAARHADLAGDRAATSSDPASGASVSVARRPGCRRAPSASPPRVPPAGRPGSRGRGSSGPGRGRTAAGCAASRATARTGLRRPTSRHSQGRPAPRITSASGPGPDRQKTPTRHRDGGSRVARAVSARSAPPTSRSVITRAT